MDSTAVDICRFCGESVLESDLSLARALSAERLGRGFHIIHGWFDTAGILVTCETAQRQRAYRERSRE